ncbi:hypothetical protein [Bradyrhizobium sp. USDA 4473]
MSQQFGVAEQQRIVDVFFAEDLMLAKLGSTGMKISRYREQETVSGSFAHRTCVMNDRIS